jgi:hypothetical protein
MCFSDVGLDLIDMRKAPRFDVHLMQDVVVVCSWRSAVSEPDFTGGQTYERHISRHIRDHHMDTAHGPS